MYPNYVKTQDVIVQEPTYNSAGVLNDVTYFYPHTIAVGTQGAMFMSTDGFTTGNFANQTTIVIPTANLTTVVPSYQTWYRYRFSAYANNGDVAITQDGGMNWQVSPTTSPRIPTKARLLLWWIHMSSADGYYTITQDGNVPSWSAMPGTPSGQGVAYNSLTGNIVWGSNATNLYYYNFNNPSINGYWMGSGAWQTVGIAYGHTIPRLVALKSNGIVHYSSSETVGITGLTPWFSGRTMYEIIWNPFIYEFVVVGDQNTISTSPDGITWTPVNLAGTGPQFSYRSITWHAALGRYIIVGTNSATNKKLIVSWKR